MIVVAIIAIFMAITLPNYFKAGKNSSKNICINNLKQIDGAIEQWVLDKNMSTGIVPSATQEEEIYAYIKGDMPVCPSKGEYTIVGIGCKPQVVCSKEEDEGHKLP